MTDEAPQQWVTVEQAERWMETPVKVQVHTPTPTGSASQTVYVSEALAAELSLKLARHLGRDLPSAYHAVWSALEPFLEGPIHLDLNDVEENKQFAAIVLAVTKAVETKILETEA